MDSRIDRVYLEKAAEGTRQLNITGFSPSGDSGDISIRDPKTGLIYISGHFLGRPFPYNTLLEYRAQDMAVLELDGTCISEWSVPTVEHPMHLAIYRARPDVNAVVHSHAIWSSAYAIAGMDIPFTLAEQMENLGTEIKCAKYGAAGESELADSIVEALGQNNAALMANHGAVTCAETLEMAFRYTKFLETIAQKNILAKILGNINEAPRDHIYADWILEGLSMPLE